ncbi:SRPBCC domain-containing protein [Noviherbaspirillum massiliense]|uniref:SRPBCC domain-containing protein n=1 Tax=Noviherbaspirillum massiliense TaxID=1465823 RepID=UPI0002FBB787|nr:SRPBCC domain-containing protein [Noviherbaspirillum massiliense]
MLEIRTEIEINASAGRVWSVLTDFAGHPAWNPFVRRIEGMPKAGERLTVWIQPPGGKGMRFRPIVLEATSEQELRWLGRVLLPGMFDGEHYFRIVPVGEDKVRFIHGERFSGVLVGLLKSSLETGTRAGFEAMNRALKARAEAGQG